MKLGDKVFSTFSNREGVILALYMREVKVSFEGNEPVLIGYEATREYWAAHWDRKEQR